MKDITHTDLLDHARQTQQQELDRLRSEVASLKWQIENRNKEIEELKAKVVMLYDSIS